MKAQKLITLDIEICKQLNKVVNASGLINELLKNYFEELIYIDELKKGK